MIFIIKERKASTKDTLATSHFVIFVKLCDSYDTLRNNFLSHFLIPVTLCSNILSDFVILVELLSHSKKCDNWCHKAYTDKNEKQVGCYVIDGVETFSDT